jgi:hypothetical protein
MKKQEDARLAGLREYDRWAKNHPNDAKKMGGSVFFGYLEKERPDLLNFRAAGSKWRRRRKPPAVRVAPDLPPSTQPNL